MINKNIEKINNIEIKTLLEERHNLLNDKDFNDRVKFHLKEDLDNFNKKFYFFYYLIFFTIIYTYISLFSYISKNEYAILFVIFFLPVSQILKADILDYFYNKKIDKFKKSFFEDSVIDKDVLITYNKVYGKQELFNFLKINNKPTYKDLLIDINKKEKNNLKTK